VTAARVRSVARVVSRMFGALIAAFGLKIALG
jgi:threonine/homoserine/homoserine lactone efflux protein